MDRSSFARTLIDEARRRVAALRQIEVPQALGLAAAAEALGRELHIEALRDLDEQIRTGALRVVVRSAIDKARQRKPEAELEELAADALGALLLSWHRRTTAWFVERARAYHAAAVTKEALAEQSEMHAAELERLSELRDPRDGLMYEDEALTDEKRCTIPFAGFDAALSSSGAARKAAAT